jgi:hypothetical protein
MGYACPVCEEPQQDAEHLANHLAFQAMTHGDDHETWLDEHAPDWASGGPAELAPLVAAHAPDAAYEVAFEDTTDGETDGARYDPDLQGAAGSHDHANDHSHGHGHSHEQGGPHFGEPMGDLDPETRDVVEDARELTREMLADDGDDDAGDAEDSGGTDGSRD